MLFTSKKFKPLLERELNNGHQAIFKFENNYGASVVNHAFSYGNKQKLFELAVLKYSAGETNPEAFDICYTTPITDDVLGHLSNKEVEETLNKINELEA